ncbi:Cell division protein FtsN [subsurface metagenome]
MEKNRILWVLLSVTLFLVVVLAGGLYLLRPIREDTGAEPSAASTIQGFDSFEYVRGREELPGLALGEQEPEEMVIIVGEKEAEKAEKEETAVVKAAPKEKRPEPVLETAKPKEAAPLKREEPAEPAPRRVRVAEFWIQTGAYKSHARAELTASSLEERGLPGRITTRQISGQTYYRVRLGPYITRKEAEKFLEWVKAIRGLESSYISLVYSQRLIP